MHRTTPCSHSLMVPMARASCRPRARASPCAANLAGLLRRARKPHGRASTSAGPARETSRRRNPSDDTKGFADGPAGGRAHIASHALPNRDFWEAGEQLND